MNLLAWFNPTRWLILAAACAALVLGYLAWADHQRDIGAAAERAKWEQAIGNQKADAARQLAAEQSKTAAAERALTDFKDRQELQDAENRETVTGLERRLRDAAGPAGRLRDPNAAGCRGGGGGAASADPAGASPGAAGGAEAGGLVSADLTRLLLDLTRSADEVNLAYASCRADALNIRATAP